MKEDSITEFMILEHGKIFTLLAKLKRKKELESFKELDSGLSRHVLAEEKAIMMLTSRGKEFPEMVEIMKEHEQIEALVKKVGNNLENSENDLKELLELMKAHVRLEDKKFYPRLDKELEGKEREVIFDKLHEALIGNIMN